MKKDFILAHSRYMVHFELDMHLTSNFIYCKIQVADCALQLDIGPTHLFFIVVIIRRENFFFILMPNLQDTHRHNVKQKQMS